MNKGQTIETLKQFLAEIPKLKERQSFDDPEYRLWVDKVQQVIVNVLGKDDEITFLSTNLPVPVFDYFTTLEVKRGYYLKRVEAYGLNLRKIIQKYGILGFTNEFPVKESLKAFISHGKESNALTKIEKILSELGIEPLIVKERASLDKDVDAKVNYYLDEADFVIILATGDDLIDGKLYPRQNVAHEVGLSQKTHPGKIIYFLEDNAEFSSNIKPKVWESFKRENMENVFSRIIIELRALGMLKVGKTNI